MPNPDRTAAQWCSQVTDQCSSGRVDLTIELRFCIVISPVRHHPFHFGCYGEMDSERFPDPADSLPDSLSQLNFVHTEEDSAVGWKMEEPDAPWRA